MNTLHSLLQLPIIPVIFVASYFYLQKYVPEWAEPERGFLPLEKSWKKIFTVNGIIATGIATVLMLFTTAGTATSITVGLVSGFLLVSAYSDLITSKVPLEILKLTFWVSLLFGAATLIINSINVTDNQRYYSTIPLIMNEETAWYYALGGVVAFLAGLLIWRRAYGIIGLVSALIAFVGIWLALYVGLVSLTGWMTTTFPDVNNEVWRNLFVYGLPTILLVLCVTAAFDVGTYDKMGGADSQALYAVGWGFAGIVGGITIGIGVMVGAVLQLLLHLFANKLGLPGKRKTVRNDPIKQFFINLKWKLWKKEGTPPTVYTAVALPFLPMLNVSIICVTLITIILG